MTLEKAIELSTNLVLRQRGVWFIGELEAVKLGIEALKVIKEDRQYGTAFVVPRLPGETKELNETRE